MVLWGRDWRSAVLRMPRALTSSLEGSTGGAGVMIEVELEEMMEETKLGEADTRIGEDSWASWLSGRESVTEYGNCSSRIA